MKPRVITFHQILGPVTLRAETQPSKLDACSAHYVASHQLLPHRQNQGRDLLCLGKAMKSQGSALPSSMRSSAYLATNYPRCSITKGRRRASHWRRPNAFSC